MLLGGKGVYPYEYMYSWWKFNKTPLPPKKAFYSELHLEDITDKDYARAQKSDLFENFRNMCLDIYELDPVCFLSAPWLA